MVLVLIYFVKQWISRGNKSFSVIIIFYIQRCNPLSNLIYVYHTYPYYFVDNSRYIFVRLKIWILIVFNKNLDVIEMEL